MTVRGTWKAVVVETNEDVAWHFLVIDAVSCKWINSRPPSSLYAVAGFVRKRVRLPLITLERLDCTSPTASKNVPT